MHLSTTGTQQRFEAIAQNFASESLAPAAAAFERDERVPPAIYEALGERGLMAVNVQIGRAHV